MTKYISAFFLLGCAAVPGLAQSIPVDFATGQAARAFIGQTQAARGEPGASDTLLGGASGIAYANNMLFVADSNRVGSGPDNNRVLIYRNVAGMIPQPTDELFYTQRCPSCVGKADIVLGQPDFTSTNPNQSDVLNTPPSASTMRTPGGVASDGKILVVADTNNNRLLIWNQIPTVNDQPADVVVGQPDFAHASIPGVTPTATSMRGPQGVWLQDGSLFVADTGNNRVLIFNHVPTSNGVAADVVLGVPNFGSAPPETENQVPIPSPSNMLNPVAVTSDGQRLYVTDIGYNRVLIWNSIPTTNQAPADVVIGQPNMNSGAPNNSYAVDSSGNQTKVLCDSTGTDPNNNNAPIFPNSCLATLSFPRYALSDGQRLFVADGGNDRVLVFSNVPTQNGISANYVVGQVGGGINQASDAADSMRTPMAMTWDGVNLYVADTYNRRINVYSPAEHNIPYSGVRNAASFEIFAVGKITIGGDIQEKDVLKVTISGTDYSYTVKKDDTLESIITSVVALINADKGDPNVFALADTVIDAIVLIARAPGSDGNNVEYSTTVTPDTALLAASAEAANLSGGMDAAKIAGGTIVSIVGDNLSDQTAEAPAGAETLPTDLGGTQVYFDGVRAPLLYVSPTQINAQIPYEFFDTTSISAWVRTVRRSGLVSVTTPVAVTIVPQNPGIFTTPGQDPRPVVATHYSSQAVGSIALDGNPTKGDVLTVTIENRSYNYTVQDGDTLFTIRDNFVPVISQDPKVMAYSAGSTFTRIGLRARVAGPAGNNIPFSATVSQNATEILTASQAALCCANVAGALVTPENPAMPGEVVVLYATGLGLPDPTDSVNTGQIFPAGGPQNKPREFVSSLIGGTTANVMYAGLMPGTVGVWEVHLELGSGTKTDPQAQVTIAQAEFVSNIATIPVFNPNPQ